MNAHLLREWERVLGLGDTIICLDDVAVPVTWRNLPVIERLRRCPGRRWLVLGNHDVHCTQELRDVGFGAECAAAVYAAEPPLALTHAPLRNVPPGAVTCTGTFTRTRQWARSESTCASSTRAGCPGAWTYSLSSCGHGEERRTRSR